MDTQRPSKPSTPGKATRGQQKSSETPFQPLPPPPRSLPQSTQTLVSQFSIKQKPTEYFPFNRKMTKPNNTDEEHTIKYNTKAERASTTESQLTTLTRYNKLLKQRVQRMETINKILKQGINQMHSPTCKCLKTLAEIQRAIREQSSSSQAENADTHTENPIPSTPTNPNT